MRTIGRTVAAAAVGVVLGASAPAAMAHVTANPSEATKGGFTKIAFRVPNEKAGASTTRVEIQLPPDEPIENVSVKPVPGWTSSLTRTGDAVSTITWQGGPINPGEFQEFEVSLGPLPDDADQLVFKALQTYSDGEIVAWIEETSEGGEEPDHPAPIVRLVEGSGDDHHDDTTETTLAEDPAEETPDPGTIDSGDGGDGEDGEAVDTAVIADVQDDADAARTIGIIGIAIGVLGLIVAALALTRGRAARQ